MIAAALVALALGSADGNLPDGGYEVDVLQDAGPIANRINVAILGDGYRMQDQAQLDTDAQNLVNGLFTFTPYMQYSQLFNVKLVHVVSVDNGASDGSYGATRNTALGSYFGCRGIDRLLCLDETTALSIAAQAVPEFNALFVVVNDPKYGGEGGTVSTVSTNSESIWIIRHELGHHFAYLADEYTAPYPGYPPCDPVADCPEPNATVFDTRAQVKWNAWIDVSTAVPTQAGLGFTGIGDFEGCRYETTGVYRPYDNACLMQALSNPFCSVCAEAMVRSLWGLVNPIDSEAPSSSTVTASQCDPPIPFSVTPALGSATWSINWKVDASSPPAGTGPSFSLDPSTLQVGTHTIAVGTQDTTALVRNDPSHTLQGAFTWSLEVVACGADGGATLDGGMSAGPSSSISSSGTGTAAGTSGSGNAGSAGAISSSAGTAGGVTGGASTGSSAGAASGGTGAAGSTGSTRGSQPGSPHTGCGCLVDAAGPGAWAFIPVLLPWVGRRQRRRGGHGLPQRQVPWHVRWSWSDRRS